VSAAEVSRAVERAARESYGRLVAILAARTRDVAAAEDALGDAFAAALARWPAQGVPERPEAWLVAAARRRLLDGRRRTRVRDAAEPALAHAADDAAQSAALDAVDALESDALPDRRLALLFACAHPAIDPAVRTPLMLQAVLGLDAAAVAAAFLTAPAAMAQRLVRAKRKLRDAGVPFAVPERAELAPRLEAVLEAIYGAFGAGWDAVAGGDAQRADLADEAIWLGRLVVDALPDEPEARGLLALMLYCHARRAARHDRDGAYVPLSAQDAARWDAALVGEAEALLSAAARALRPGRFQLEAALQSAHLAPAYGRARDWGAIAALYDALARHAPTVGVLVGRAAAIGEARGAAAGLDAADAIVGDGVDGYQPWWALRAHLLARAGRAAEARAAYGRAAGMTADASVRAFLLARRDAGGVVGPDERVQT
jgi:RNA polymerase sigma-70 factor (ECF subfamily)